MLYGFAEISSPLCLLLSRPQTAAHTPLLLPRALHPSLWMDPQPLVLSLQLYLCGNQEGAFQMVNPILPLSQPLP